MRCFIFLFFITSPLFADSNQLVGPNIDTLNKWLERSDYFADKTKKEFKEMAPEAVLLSCSDLGFLPEMAFNTPLGKIYSIQNAGPLVDKVTIASIEYAVQKLGAKLLIVLGHTSCPVVKNASTTKESKNVGELASVIQAHLQSARFVASEEDPTLRLAVSAHIAGTVTDLLKRSSVVRRGVNQGTLLIAEAVFDPTSGKIELLRRGRTLASEKAKAKPKVKVEAKAITVSVPSPSPIPSPAPEEQSAWGVN